MKIKEVLKANKFIYGTYQAYQKFLCNEKFERKRQDKYMNQIFGYYWDRFYKYSGAFCNGYVKDRAYLTWAYHVIEKGICMPNRRLGFAKGMVLQVIETCESYEQKYKMDDVLKDAIATLKEYKKIHQDSNFSLDKDLDEKLNAYLEKHSDIEVANHPLVEFDDFYSDVNESFEKFAYSRHSLRDYDAAKDIPVEQLIDCVRIAQTAPSACNRQHARVHIITDKKDIADILAMQSGNRGFGQLTNKLLVVTGDLQTILGAQEYLDLNTNVGIFIMNLVYALHYKKIANCVVNWYALPKEDNKIRKIADIPESENVVALILCGIAPQEFRVVESRRLKTEDIYTVK